MTLTYGYLQTSGLLLWILAEKWTFLLKAYVSNALPISISQVFSICIPYADILELSKLSSRSKQDHTYTHTQYKSKINFK